MAPDPSEGFAASVRERLLRERQALLDLSARNRLLNVPLRTRNVRTVEIVDEKAGEVYRRLADGKAFSFLPGRELAAGEQAQLEAGDLETGGIPQPEDQELGPSGVARRHMDLRLQTKLTSEGLQKRLFDIWYDARTLEEEQGVNILYLALGLLRWRDGSKKATDPFRHAPLVLMPVQLERASATEKFKLRGRGEPASPNLSLQAKLKADFHLALEDFADEDELDLDAYCARAAELVAGEEGWEVQPDAMVLGFFSFAKFLMYRDLDPEHWPAEAPIDRHPLIAALLRDGYSEPDAGSEPLVESDEAPIDALIAPRALLHVVDADSSQAVVIEEAARGRTLVVKGPPGTGKSQTITNVIAAAVGQGRRVLFVAEKMAALDVVHGRLKAVGLGALALELHSRKANKRTLLAELKRTKELLARPGRVDPGVVDALGPARDVLNAHAENLHRRLDPSRLSAFEILGRLLGELDEGAPAYPLPAVPFWDPAAHDERRRLARELGERLAALGSPAVHPWRGVGRGPLDPMERAALGRSIAALRADLETLAPALRVAETLGVAVGTPADLERAAAALKVAASFPESDRSCLAAPAWRERELDVLLLPAAGADAVIRRSEAEDVFLPAAFAADPAPIRRALATKGASFFRFLDGDYREQIALLRSYLKGPLPGGVERRLALVDLWIASRSATAIFQQLTGVGPAFGRLWRGEASDWQRLQRIADWWSDAMRLDLPPAFLARLAETDPEPIARAEELAAVKVPAALAGWRDLVATLDLDARRAFGVDRAEQVALDVLTERLEAWRPALESITRWIAVAERCRKAIELGLGTLVDAALDDRLPAADIEPAFERSYFEALRADLFIRFPDLKAFDGDLHERRVERFRELDVERMALAREEVAERHWQAIPRAKTGIGPLGVVNGELAKKRNLLPIRQLIARGGAAIQALKPIFLMSPLSVAQFLKPGAIHFDLLIMDEASQIEPVDALGGIARARQLVVVGDERQLPPTRFFAKLTGEDADVDEESDEYYLQARTVESVLDLCLAKGLPHRILNWHYRSRHHSLIAVSNRQFYDDRLLVVPSPYDIAAGIGLRFHHLPHAIYGRGNTRSNPIEARAVAEAAIAHARAHPGRSLGVATFSTAQRQAILQELELLRRAHPETEPFFSGLDPAGGLSNEPFFVKNLENVQGDERDVIFISVGYGRAEDGRLAMSFGPLTGEGGERRLNVLISRAKLRCEVFSSIVADDIDLGRARSLGVAALKTFLAFAQSGRLAAAEQPGAPGSLLEDAIAERLERLGYLVRRRVGVAGIFVDLAIADPERPDRCVLGIELDGPQYRDARSARDRDRLRPAVLESQGWILHRIWSVDWYLRPGEELAKLTAAVEAAIATWRERDADAARDDAAWLDTAPTLASPDAASPVDAARLEGVEDPISEPDAGSAISVPYIEALFPVDILVEPHELPGEAMARHVARVVEVEGPIHVDEIVTRLRLLWGLGRAGHRFRATIEQALDLAVATGAIEGAGEFWSVPGAEVPVRDRSLVGSPSLRRPEALAPAEIEAAIVAVVDANFGASRHDLAQAVARVFGFASTSAQLRQRILASVEPLVASGRLKERGDLLVVAATGNSPTAS